MIRPTLDDLSREAKLGTISLIPTLVILAGILLVAVDLPVSDPELFGTGAMFGGGAVIIYLSIDRLIEEILVERELVRPRRDPYDEPEVDGR